MGAASIWLSAMRRARWVHDSFPVILGPDYLKCYVEQRDDHVQIDPVRGNIAALVVRINFKTYLIKRNLLI